MKKIIENLEITSNIKKVDLIYFFDLSEKEQKNIIDYYKSYVNREDLENNWILKIQGFYYPISEVLNLSNLWDIQDNNIRNFFLDCLGFEYSIGYIQLGYQKIFIAVNNFDENFIVFNTKAVK